MINDNTTISAEILLRNGWEDIDLHVFEFGEIRIHFIEGFSAWLSIGEPFYTIGELKAISKALYKVELKFE